MWKIAVLQSAMSVELYCDTDATVVSKRTRLAV